MNCDLPYEELLGRGWQTITGNPADELALAFGNHAAVSEMRTLQQVAISRIGIQWRAVFDEG